MTILSPKQYRHLRKLVIRQLRVTRKEKYEKLNLIWLKIRKQKDRRRRRTLEKLYRLERIRLMKQQAGSILTMSA